RLVKAGGKPSTVERVDATTLCGRGATMFGMSGGRGIIGTSTGMVASGASSSSMANGAAIGIVAFVSDSGRTSSDAGEADLGWLLGTWMAGFGPGGTPGMVAAVPRARSPSAGGLEAGAGREAAGAGREAAGAGRA